MDQHHRSVKSEKQFGMVGLSGSRSNRAPDGHNLVRSDEGKTALAVEGRTRPEIAESDSAEVDLDVDGGIFSVVDDKKASPRTSRCTKANGCHIDIKYDLRNFKEVYRDECTDDILPQKHVVEAIREELNDFNNTVRHLAEPPDTRKLKDSKTVTSRWVVCNKVDAESPHVRARLVAGEVNTSGTKGFLSLHQPLPWKQMHAFQTLCG